VGREVVRVTGASEWVGGIGEPRLDLNPVK